MNRLEQQLNRIKIFVNAHGNLSDKLAMQEVAEALSQQEAEPVACKECGSKDLSWFPAMRNTSGVVDGRLKLNEVVCDFALGCNECSETLKVIAADAVAELLTVCPPLPQPVAEQVFCGAGRGETLAARAEKKSLVIDRA